MQKTPTKTPTYQERLAQDDHYSLAVHKLNDLQHHRIDILARREELQATHHSPLSPVERDAQSLLDGEPPSSDPRGDVIKTHCELAVIEEAIRLQEAVVGREESRVVAGMRDANQPRHAELLRSFRDTLLAAEEAAAELDRFYDDTANTVHRTMRFRGFGEFIPKTGRLIEIQKWQAEAEEFGCLED